MNATRWTWLLGDRRAFGLMVARVAAFAEMIVAEFCEAVPEARTEAGDASAFARRWVVGDSRNAGSARRME